MKATKTPETVTVEMSLDEYEALRPRTCSAHCPPWHCLKCPNNRHKPTMCEFCIAIKNPTPEGFDRCPACGKVSKCTPRTPPSHTTVGDINCPVCRGAGFYTEQLPWYCTREIPCLCTLHPAAY